MRREMSKRARYPLEWGGGEWAANVCAANCYRGSKEGVGAHADHITCAFRAQSVHCCFELTKADVEVERSGPVSDYCISVAG